MMFAMNAVIFIWILIALYETYNYFWSDSIRREADESIEQLKNEVGIEKLNRLLFIAGMVSLVLNFVIVYAIYYFYPTDTIVAASTVLS